MGRTDFEHVLKLDVKNGAAIAELRKVLVRIMEEKKKPTQFQEPDGNSLLDAFGF